MTIPDRILLHVAIGAGIMIAVATGVTYELVYNGVKQRDLNHLDVYVAERARREEGGFSKVRENLTLVRGQFLKRLETMPADGLETKWNERFQLFPDGAWRSYEKFADGRKYSTMWAHKDCVLTPELKRQVLCAQDLCDELLPGWVDVFPSVYFVLPGWLNIGYDPRIPSWVWQTPADYSATNLEWFMLAMPNTVPEDRITYTGVIEEPTTKIPLVSVYIPILQDGHFMGSIGHDLSLARLMEETAKAEIPGVSHVIFRSDGRLIAHPTRRKDILASKGELRMQSSGEPALESLYRAVSGRKEARFSGFDEVSGLYYSVARLNGPEWLFLTTLPRELLQRQAFKSAQWVLWSGLVSLALVLGFLATTLRRQIAHPLVELTRATKQMSAGSVHARARVLRRDEFGELAGAFNEMAAGIAQRDADLQAEKASLERRVAERTAELRESEARFSMAFQTSPVLMTIARLEDGRFIEVNPAFIQHIGVTREQIIGRDSKELGLWVDLDARAEFFGKLKQDRVIRNVECSIRTARGSIHTMLLSGEIIEINRQPHLITFALDITQTKQAEAELQNALAKERELNLLKSDFVALVSHEFRTPLEIIMSSVDNLDRYHDRLPPEKREQLLKTINKSVRRMAGMMEEVLVLGRVESGKMEFKPESFDLPGFCQRIVEEIQSVTNRRCPIEVQTEGVPSTAFGDENVLRHILSNLLSNAVKYSPEGQTVGLKVMQNWTNAVFIIKDKGCGIPEADCEKLFQAFHRGSNVRQVPGTGLGLVIVARCVQIYGGRIEFSSVEGQGTEFTVTLPLFMKAT